MTDKGNRGAGSAKPAGEPRPRCNHGNVEGYCNLCSNEWQREVNAAETRAAQPGDAPKLTLDDALKALEYASEGRTNSVKPDLLGNYINKLLASRPTQAAPAPASTEAPGAPTLLRPCPGLEPPLHCVMDIGHKGSCVSGDAPSRVPPSAYSRYDDADNELDDLKEAKAELARERDRLRLRVDDLTARLAAAPSTEALIAAGDALYERMNDWESDEAKDFAAMAEWRAAVAALHPASEEPQP